MNLNEMLDTRLPLNRKERFFTGTVFPMIVASGGFAHLGRFLALCGVPPVSIRADPANTNIQFFTEYSLKEARFDGADERFAAPDRKETPDVVIYVEDDQCPCLVVVEAKVFHVPTASDFAEQLTAQTGHIDAMVAGLGTDPSVYHVVLLPAGHGVYGPVGTVTVVTWEQLADAYRDAAPAYWIAMLDEAMERYPRLVSVGHSSYGRNADAKLRGQEIVDLWRAGDHTYQSVGRSRGLDGPAFRGDVATGHWRTQKYEVRTSHEPRQNWFTIEEFVQAVMGG